MTENKTTRKQIVSAVRWPKGKEHYKKTIEERSCEMGVSESQYCGIIITEFLESGRKIILEG